MILIRYFHVYFLLTLALIFSGCTKGFQAISNSNESNGIITSLEESKLGQSPTPSSTTVTTVTWTRCADENGTCFFTGTRQVRYGLNGTYYFKTATGSIGCNNSVFGDPLPTIFKACDYSSTTSTSPAPAPAPAPAPLPTGAVLPVPTNIANGTTVSLQCGTTYQGTLNLSGKSNITVQTVGTCGRAVITPAVQVSGWSQYSGNIYVANVTNQVSQVFADGQYLGEAHHPNSVSEGGWIKPTGTSGDSISVSGLPSNDIVGAKVTFRGWEWQLGTRTVTAFNGGTMNLSARGSAGNYFDDTPPGPFYLEGKLWMLDSAGEWAWSGGKLYVWMPDGQAPGTRVAAAGNVDAVNASNSFFITLNGVRIIGGKAGVNGTSAQTLKVLNSEIAYSIDGVILSGSGASGIDNTDLNNIVRTGVNSGWGSTNATVNNSRLTNINMVGMHKGSEGEIMFGGGSGASITNNTITNGGKSGIALILARSALVKGNTVNGACLIHSDCGGIYTFTNNNTALDIRIENNKVSNVNGIILGPYGQNRHGIYLDYISNAVTVIGNTVTTTNCGMLIHGFNNTISGNTFTGNVEQHVWLAGSTAHNNAFSYNTFVGPVRAFFLFGPGLENYATFIGNTYQNYGGSPVGNPSNLSY